MSLKNMKLLKLFLFLLIMVNGFTALALQVIGPKFLVVSFGSTNSVWASVLTVALIGLGAGYWLGGRQHKNPLKLLLINFIAISAFLILISVFTWPLASVFASTSIFNLLLVSLILFLAPFTLLGANSTIIVGYLNSSNFGTHQSNSSLVYGFSTLANVAGGLIAGFYLVPFVGLTNSLQILGILLASLILLMMYVYKQNMENLKVHIAETVDVTSSLKQTKENLLKILNKQKSALLVLAFFSGVISLTLEASAPRVLTVGSGGSTILWGSILAVTLGGLGIGYLIAGKIKAEYSKKALVTVLLVNGFMIWLASWVAYSNIFTTQTSWEILLLTIYTFFIPFLLFGIEAQLVVNLIVDELNDEDASFMTGVTFAISTCGAVVGALIGAFFLISNLGLSLTILLAAFSYVALAFLTFPSTKTIILTAAVLFVIPLLPLPSWNWNINLKLEDYQESKYQSIRVYTDGKTFRRMNLGKSFSSEVDITNGNPSFRYSQNILESIGDISGDEAVVIGGAGHAISKALEKRDAQVAEVEIDPEVIEISDKYFGKINGRSVNQDGRKYIDQLNKDNKEVDLIVLDAFKESGSIPGHLLTKEFFEEVDQSLSDDGLFVINFIGTTYKPYDSAYLAVSGTLKSEFEYVSQQGVNGNILFYASRNKNTIPKNTTLLKHEPNETKILTDNLNPIDVYMLQFSQYWNSRNK